MYQPLKTIYTNESQSWFAGSWLMCPIWSVFCWGAWVPYTNLGYLRSVYANLRHVEDRLPWKHMSIAAPTRRAYAAYAALQNTHMISLCSISCSCILSKFDLKKIRCSFMGNIEVAINYCIQRCDRSVCPVLQWSCTLLLVVSEPSSKKGDYLPWWDFHPITIGRSKHIFQKCETNVYSLLMLIVCWLYGHGLPHYSFPQYKVI